MYVGGVAEAASYGGDRHRQAPDRLQHPIRSHGRAEQDRQTDVIYLSIYSCLISSITPAFHSRFRQSRSIRLYLATVKRQPNMPATYCYCWESPVLSPLPSIYRHTTSLSSSFVSPLERAFALLFTYACVSIQFHFGNLSVIDRVSIHPCCCLSENRARDDPTNYRPYHSPVRAHHILHQLGDLDSPERKD